MFHEADYPISIPCIKEGKQIDDIVFKTKKEFLTFVENLFLEPGQYNFDESTVYFKEQGNRFTNKGYYCDAPEMSKDFITYWDNEKRKCRNGVIFINGVNKWYLPREYYMWLNFLPIYDKTKKIYDFPQIWDVQYHMALYEIIAQLNYLHAVCLKKRQIAYSYFHAAKVINSYWFEEGAKSKIGASHKSYVDENGTWKMIQEYSDFLNEHTAWYRAHNPSKVMNWEQKIQVNIGGKDINKGLKSSIKGLTFDRDPTAGVGGPTSIFWYEEGGIAPTADKTYEYMRPALSNGMITTGIFIIGGSVGDLKQCEPLRNFMMNPKANGFMSVFSNLIDDTGIVGEHGLFIPEQWSMPPYIDEFGNSLVEEALAAIQKEREDWKRDLDPAQYQLRISQKPINIKEAFDYRDESKFPKNIITGQIRKIEDKVYPMEYIDLNRDIEGNIVAKKSRKYPIKEFPVSKKEVNKEGVLVVYERPVEKPKWTMYYASIDPVADGKTSTSVSLCSIYVYKNTVEKKIISPSGQIEKVVLEPGKIVASWCGRFDDIKNTNEMLLNIIEWYNAWTLVEANISTFINFMIREKKQKYLVPKSQIVFLKELNYNNSSYNEFGWKKTGKLFEEHMITYVLEFIKEVIDEEFDENGNPIKKTYGVERIPDIMLLKEMLAYRDGLNVDRLIAFAALVVFIKIQESNIGYLKITEEVKQNLQKSLDLFNFNRTPFKSQSKSFKRSAFKNIR